MGRYVLKPWWELVREGAAGEVRRRHRVAPVAGSAGAGGRVARRTVPDVGRVTSDQVPWPEAARAGEEAEAGLGPAGGVARGRGGTHGTRPRVCLRRRAPRHPRDPPAGPRPQAQDAARPAGGGRRGPQGRDALAGGPRPRQGGAHGGAGRRARMPQGKGGARARGPARAHPPAAMRPAPAPTGTGAPTGACSSSRPAARRPTRPPTPGRSRAGTARRATAATRRRRACPCVLSS